jgi:hypothetical protein
MEQQQVKSFASAAKIFFGLKDGQSLKDFLGEVQQLSPEDKSEIAAGMERNGIKIVV